MTLLTGLGALAALAAVLPLAAWAVGQRRTDAVRATLGLQAPDRRRLVRPLLAAAAICILGLAAAQPALTRTTHVRERTDVQELFVFDVSRSMAASRTPRSPTRLDRAIAAALELRAATAEIPAGVATLTDRVLPDLAPVSDRATFDATVTRGVGIESPPPASTEVRATTYAALGDIASGDYFAPSASRRLVVLLTDGESRPVDPGAIARSLPPARGYRFLTIRFWRGGESVYDAEGRRERAYRPDPLGRVVLDELARALGGRALDEGQLHAAQSDLRAAAGNGPTRSASTGAARRTALAPFLAALALVLLVTAVVPLRKGESGLQSAVP